MRRSSGSVFAVWLATAAFAALLGLVAARVSAQATSAPVVATTAPADADKVACAVLPTVLSAAPDHPLSSLVEQELLKGGRYRVVDRQQLGAVLNEQLLQAAIAAEGLRARQDVGKVVRAGLLVLIGAPERAAQADGAQAPVTTRAAGPKGAGATRPASARSAAGTPLAVGDTQPYVPLVIAETKQGLRLLTAKLPWDEKNGEATAAKIAGMVETARQTLAGGIRAVFAVPPFESEDLSFEYDHLMGAYAAIVAQALARQPGVLMVELAEAQALARELAVSTGPTTVSRGLPYYVMGRYRHAVLGAERTVAVHVELRQGETVIGTIQESDVADAAVAVTLDKVADQFLKTALGNGLFTSSRPDPAREAELLRNRALAFIRMGDWCESCVLLDASLLLEPDCADAHRQAVIALVRMMWAADPNTPAQKEASRKSALYRRGLYHAEWFLRLPDPVGGRRWDYALLSDLRDCRKLFPWSLRAQPSTELLAVRNSVLQEERDMYLRVLEDKQAAGTLNRTLINTLVPLVLDSKTDSGESAAQEFAQRLRAIHVVANHPDWVSGELITEAVLGAATELQTTPEYQAFLQEVAALPGERGRVALVKLRSGPTGGKEAVVAPRPLTTQIAPAEDESGAEHVKLRPFTAADLGLPAGARLFSSGPGLLLTLGPGLDFLLHHREPYLIEGPGKARRAFPSERELSHGSPPRWAWDGKYIWASVQFPAPQLVLLDPASERTWHFGEKEGWPATSADDAFAAIGPGKAFVAGSLYRPGARRGWIGILAFDGDQGRITVNVLREFRGQPYALRFLSAEPPDLDIFLAACFVATVADPSNPAAQRVLVNQNSRLLVIDPAQGTVDVLPGLGWVRNMAVRDGFVYYVSCADIVHPDSAIMRVGFPDFRAEELARIGEPAPDAPVFFDGDGLHVIGRKRWWYAPSAKGPFSSWAMDHPAEELHGWQIQLTQTYGPLVQLTRNTGLCTVELPRSIGSAVTPGR